MKSGGFFSTEDLVYLYPHPRILSTKPPQNCQSYNVISVHTIQKAMSLGGAVFLLGENGSPMFLATGWNGDKNACLVVRY